MIDARAAKKEAAEGLGTAMVYPTLIAAVSDFSDPLWRGTAIGVYRFWRDIGYVVGALGGGLVADRLGLPAALVAIGALTTASGAAAAWQMRAP